MNGLLSGSTLGEQNLVGSTSFLLTDTHGCRDLGRGAEAGTKYRALEVEQAQLGEEKRRLLQLTGARGERCRGNGHWLTRCLPHRGQRCLSPPTGRRSHGVRGVSRIFSSRRLPLLSATLMTPALVSVLCRGCVEGMKKCEVPRSSPPPRLPPSFGTFRPFIAVLSKWGSVISE